MCGICGVLDRKHRLLPIVEMNNIQRHRGPDDEGYLFINSATGHWQAAGGGDTHVELNLLQHRNVVEEDFDLVLGSRRLAILDLSMAGHMPMSYHGGNFWITYNGEVYNYLELRQELEGLGHTFVNNTDTEVILAAYAEWNTDCLSHLNGMFAFAIWDFHRKRLFCARDRFGVKPFYYYWDGESFIFASEIKSLLQHPLVPRTPNDINIFDYLALGMSDHTEQTFFQGVNLLPAAHFLLVDVIENRIVTRRWWQIEINSNIEPIFNIEKDDVYSEFAELLTDAVRLRLRSDVPIGSCLSGGLDSSAVVCLANQLLLEEQVVPRNLVGDYQMTFTARNTQLEIDEYKYSHLVVEQTGARENLIIPQGDVLWQEIESFVWYMDEPVDSTSQYPQWNVMRLAREKGVTVLLDGQGGDEILAGYYSYFPPYLSHMRAHKGLLAAMHAGWQISRVGGSPVTNMLLSQTLQQLPWRFQQLLRRIWTPRTPPGTGGSGLQQWQLADELVQKFWERRWQPVSLTNQQSLASLLYRDLTSTNLPKLLRYEDRNSMAFSLETRLPFLDYRLVEKVFALPLNYRIYRGWNKWILRHSLSQLLPDEICWRRSKLGYPTPEKEWLAQGIRFIREAIHYHGNGQITNYVDPNALRRIQKLDDQDLAATPGIWRLVNLIVWLDVFFQRPEYYATNTLSSSPVHR